MTAITDAFMNLKNNAFMTAFKFRDVLLQFHQREKKAFRPTI